MRPWIAAAIVLGLAAQDYPPAFPRTNVTELLNTDRIRVWDIVWPKGEPTPLHRHLYDQVGTYYQAGGRIITSPDGTKRETFTPVGNVSTTRRGTTHIEEGATETPLRAVFVELKTDEPSGLPEIPAEVSPAFPREGARQLLDNERVTVWDYTWSPGVQGVPGRYGHETLWVWLAPGTLRVTPRDGAPASVIRAVPGDIRYLARGTVETDVAIEGAPRAMMFAFK